MSQSRPENDDLPRELARKMDAWGLGSVALITLEAGRPLALLAAQLVWFVQPLAGLAWNPRRLTQLAQLLEEPGSIDTVIAYLEGDS
jgi:hypothetical protein